MGPPFTRLKINVDVDLLRVQLKVPGDSSDLSVLLTKKSLMSLLRLNEMSGGSEKILLVSLSF